MELSKQEMELFLLLRDLKSKTFFYKKFLTFKSESKTCFENRKYNYPNRKWNYFSYFLTSNQKTSLTKNVYLSKTNPKLVLKTGNRIIQTLSTLSTLSTLCILCTLRLQANCLRPWLSPRRGLEGLFLYCVLI